MAIAKLPLKYDEGDRLISYDANMAYVIDARGSIVSRGPEKFTFNAKSQLLNAFLPGRYDVTADIFRGQGLPTRGCFVAVTQMGRGGQGPPRPYNIHMYRFKNNDPLSPGTVDKDLMMGLPKWLSSFGYNMDYYLQSPFSRRTAMPSRAAMRQSLPVISGLSCTAEVVTKHFAGLSCTPLHCQIPIRITSTVCQPAIGTWRRPSHVYESGSSLRARLERCEPHTARRHDRGPQRHGLRGRALLTQRTGLFLPGAD
ncbi:hypothetical protein CEXT_423561 [Caerostris extrusa]|uniref:Teneurin-like YD-shell domain-containing protein n=1 Tax=Caerostris extrusa TaxID=172846 RepID=A0AAV4SXS1_CAEEX|nr:hypothetical protein CEXT_423561 [Caerostris extrusa]